MTTPNNAKAKSTTKENKAASVARAKDIVEGYHEGNGLEDRILRKDLIIHTLICMVSSDWWMANDVSMRVNMLHFMVQVDDTMDALDIIHN